MSKPEELRQLADKFSEGWHEGIKIDAMDVMLLSDAASELETMQAILAKQPATSEPVASRNPFASRCYTMSESHLSGHRLIVGFEKLGDAQDAHEWVARQARGDFTHPAPSVLKDDQIAALVNKVRDIARMFHDHQSLRERIAIELVPALKASQEVKSNAERYRWLRDHDHWPAPFSSSQEPEPVRGRDLDSNIDAAMLAAK